MSEKYDLVKLKQTLDADPAYAPLSDDAAASRLNERVRPGAVSSGAIMEVVVTRGLYYPIYKLSQSTLAPEPQVAAAVTLLAVMKADFQVNYGHPAVRTRMTAMMDNLIAGGAIDAQAKQAIMALGDNIRTRGEEAGVGTVYGGYVHGARNL